MRVLLDHPCPFLLSHGGFQIQIEQTARGLREIGLDVQFLRWWDASQYGDILHYFGRPHETYLAWARRKGMAVVIEDLLTEMGAKPARTRLMQKLFMQTAKAALPASFLYRLAWNTYRQADAVIANTSWEARLLREMFDVALDKAHVIPNGVEEVFLQSPRQDRGPWLVCTATVTERKRVVELAQAAILSQTPVWIIGKPYAPDDPYAQRFEALARANPKWIRYEGPIIDRAHLAAAYRSARGFVLLSTMETLSLSAAEAAACECPLLLSDLPWARAAFGADATYCPIASPAKTAPILRQFYERAPSLPRPPRPQTWKEVAGQFKTVYDTVLKRSQ